MTFTERILGAPRFVQRWLIHFECEILDAVAGFAASLPPDVLVLDAGCGEGQHRGFFLYQRYVGVDLAVGDAGWDYGALDALANLNALPFPEGTFEAAINIVTLEHLRDPAAALLEIGRVLKPGGRLLLVAPLEWEEHQQPHDFFRYTQFGLRMLLESAGFCTIELRPVGGFFRLLSRRLLNGLQFFMRGAGWLLFVPAVLLFVPLSLVLPLLERLDRDRNFTLGYICTARKSP